MLKEHVPGQAKLELKTVRNNALLCRLPIFQAAWGIQGGIFWVLVASLSLHI